MKASRGAMSRRGRRREGYRLVSAMDPVATEVWETAVRAPPCRSLLHMTLTVDAERIIVGGGLSP